METQEGQNQPEIAPKRVKFQEIIENGEDDRISGLPDSLLLDILSRLESTEDAIKTGTLSKRWNHLWTSVHTLSFTYSLGKYDSSPQELRSMSDFISFVDKTLSQYRQSKLKKFKLDTRYDIQFESQFNNWIRYAISCNVEELSIKLSCDPESRFLLDPLFFISSCFTDLTLVCVELNPIEAMSWKNLGSLHIFYGELDEDVIENILSGSPLLETLELGDCYGFRRLDISSKSVKKLVLNGYRDPWEEVNHMIEINAPNIASLKIRGFMFLDKLLLLNVSCVVEANLHYWMLGRRETRPYKAEEETLKGFILKLCHVKKLKLGSHSSTVLSRLEAKGFVSPPNIKLSSKW